MAARRQSVVPPEGLGRRKSIYVERKQSVDGKKSALDLPNAGRRRSSIVDGRRMSIYSNADGSIMGRSGMSADKNRMNVKYENTYKLEPDDKFPIHKAKKIATDLLAQHLDGKDYNKEECTRNSKTLTELIKQNVKALGYPRYKIVTIVAIGQKQAAQPSLSFTSRCIWNEKYDSFAEASFKNRELYAVALVYAIYAD